MCHSSDMKTYACAVCARPLARALNTSIQIQSTNQKIRSQDSDWHSCWVGQHDDVPVGLLWHHEEHHHEFLAQHVPLPEDSGVRLRAHMRGAWWRCVIIWNYWSVEMYVDLLSCAETHGRTSGGYGEYIVFFDGVRVYSLRRFWRGSFYWSDQFAAIANWAALFLFLAYSGLVYAAGREKTKEKNTLSTRGCSFC